MQGKVHWLRYQKSWNSFLALAGCVTWGNSADLSEPLFPYLQKGEIQNFLEGLGGSNVMMYLKAAKLL